MNNDDRAEGAVYEDVIDYNEVLKAKKLTFQDIRDHMSGPVVSLMLHVIVIAFLSTIIVFKAPEEGKKIEVKYLKIKPKVMIKPPEPPKEIPLEDPVIEREIERPNQKAIEPDVPKVESIPNPIPTPPIDLVLKKTPSHKILPVASMPPSRTKKGIEEAVNKRPTGTKSQKILFKGLRWLKDHQNPDGSWGDTSKGNFPAYTGLALLAFLGHGETPSSAEFGPTVLKAIKKLVEFVGKDGKGVKGGYRHGIVMYALNEAYIMTRIPMLEEIVKNGNRRIVNGLNEKGSFNYGYDNTKMRCDLSVSGWNYQALKAAFVSGCDVEGLVPAIDKLVVVGLKKTHSVKNGGFSYGSSGGAKGSMTAVGTLCLQLYGYPKSPEVIAGVRILEQANQFTFNWKGYNKKVPQWGLYQWYYQTQVFFQAYNGRGRRWGKWDKMVVNELYRRQKKDGRWESPQYTLGSKEKNGGHGEGSLNGLDQPVYSTSLCCLMLEVYYRTLSTSARHTLENNNLKKGLDDEDDLGLTMTNNEKIL